MTETSKARFETRRNYSLRLQGDGQEWKEALWRTHEMVNAGTKCVADWLLTLRGGLDASYVSSIEDPLEAKWARKLLVLSWLSVESALGAPQQYLLAGQEASEPTEDVASRERVMINALMDILKLKGVSTEDSGIWIEDCRSSLCASLREDATWVNRAQAFEDLAKRVGTISQDDVWDLLGRVFVSPQAYLGRGGTLADQAPLIQPISQWLSKPVWQWAGCGFRTACLGVRSSAYRLCSVQTGSDGGAGLREAPASCEQGRR